MHKIISLFIIIALSSCNHIKDQEINNIKQIKVATAKNNTSAIIITINKKQYNRPVLRKVNGLWVIPIKNIKKKYKTLLPKKKEVRVYVKKEKKKPKIYNNLKVVDNLWEEISNNYTLFDYKDKDIYWHIKWFKDNPDYLTRVTKRAGLYLKAVFDEVKKQGLPYEIALLPIVESAYYPFAYSHGTASGMWQFIPSTAKLYGLKQNFWIDERRDILRSTRAAISYLSSLHKLFNKNWYHAIAAYNSGPGRVQKAIAKNKRLGKKTDFWHLDLPKETIGYVPRLLAVAKLIKNPSKYNQILTIVKNKKIIGEVLLKNQLDLSIISEWTNLSIDEIYKLNAGLNRWATPNTRYHLILPVEKITSFRKKLKNYPKNKRIKWVRHKVKSGDSIIGLANKYATSSELIKQINKLKSNKIIIGKYIIIPIASKNKEYYSLSQAQLEEQRLGKNIKKIIYSVKKDDTLWDVAKKYKVSVKQLIKWNYLPSKTIIIKGDNLIVWKEKPVRTNKLAKIIETKNNAQSSITYRVKSGDNLSKIAYKFKVSTIDITNWNNLNSNNLLKIGKKLKLFIKIVNN